MFNYFIASLFISLQAKVKVSSSKAGKKSVFFPELALET
jgi:hypothetical protein